MQVKTEEKRKSLEIGRFGLQVFKEDGTQIAHENAGFYYQSRYKSALDGALEGAKKALTDPGVGSIRLIRSSTQVRTTE